VSHAPSTIRGDANTLKPANDIESTSGDQQQLVAVVQRIEA
jgi:hypothetical protein